MSFLNKTKQYLIHLYFITVITNVQKYIEMKTKNALIIYL